MHDTTQHPGQHAHQDALTADKDRGGRWRHWTGLLADALRVAAAASLVAAVLWYPVEAWLRFALLLGLLILPRWIGVPRPFDAAFAATLLLATWAGVAQWYTSIVWMDEVVHFVTIAAVAPTAYLALVVRGLLPGLQQPPVRAHRLSVVILTVSLGLAVATLWEFYEWAADQLPNDSIHVGYDDTIADLALGGCGALLTGLALAKWAATSGLGARRARTSP